MFLGVVLDNQFAGRPIFLTYLQYSDDSANEKPAFRRDNTGGSICLGWGRFPLRMFLGVAMSTYCVERPILLIYLEYSENPEKEDTNSSLRNRRVIICLC